MYVYLLMRGDLVLPSKMRKVQYRRLAFEKPRILYKDDAFFSNGMVVHHSLLIRRVATRIK